MDYSSILGDLRARLDGLTVDLDGETARGFGAAPKRGSQLGVVNLGIIDYCDFKCKFCGRWKKTDRVAFDLPHYKRVIDQLTEFQAEPRKLRLAGGEVLILDELPELMDYASKRNWTVEICTNGYYINADMAKKFNDYGVGVVAISLDTLNEKKHDRLRGKEGSYRKVMEAIELLGTHAPKVYTLFMTLIIKQNLDDLVSLVSYVDKSTDVRGVFLQVLYSNMGDDWLYRHTNKQLKGLLPPKGETARVLPDLIAMKRAGSRIENSIPQLERFVRYYEEPFTLKRSGSCPIKDYHAVIDEGGDVRLCPYDDAVGNVHKKDLKGILASSAANAMRTKMGSCTQYCYSVLNCLFDDEHEQLQREAEHIVS